LAANAIAAGGTVPVALNAANEVAVQAFLKHQLPFTGIYQLVDSVLQKYASVRPDSIDTVLSEDVRARELARQLLR
jgi:1-deoxy-D-xylulose-5-phosphate reductoisomerase